MAAPHARRAPDGFPRTRRGNAAATMTPIGPVATIAAIANFALALLALLRGGKGPLTRLLAALATALGVWNATLALAASGYGPGMLRVSLAAAAAASPLALQFVLALSAGTRAMPPRLAPWLARGAWLLTALFVATIFVPAIYEAPAFNAVAIAFHSVVLATALFVLARRLRASETTVERRLFRLLLAGGLVAVVGGILDLVPGLGVALPRLGSIAVLLYTILLSGIVMPAGWIEGPEFVTSALSKIAAAGVAAAILSPLLGAEVFPLFAALVLLLLFFEPVRQAISRRADFTGRRRLDLAPAAEAIASRLGRAATEEEVKSILRETIRAFPKNSFAALYLHDPARSVFALLAKSGDAPRLPIFLAEDDPIALAAGESRHALFHAAIPAPARRAPETAAVRAGRDAVRRLGAEVALPLASSERLAGLLVAGGEIPAGAYLPENLALVLGLASQAAAGLDRCAAQREAREKERLAEMGELSASMAHEIRNPLGAIHGAAQVLEDESRLVHPSLHELVSVIARESRRLARVVSSFLELGRPLEVRKEPIDLVALAAGALRAVRAEGAPEAIEFEVEPPERPAVAAADGDLLGAVFVNLARNAVESMGGSGRLAVRFETRPGAGETCVRFEDTGPGVPESEREAIFRPFFSTKARGTGLGLAISRRIVEAHGGRLACAPRNGKAGAAFELVLPLALEPAAVR